MKQPLLILLLVVATYFYFRDSATPGATGHTAAETKSPPQVVALPPGTSAIATAPSYKDRWKTGPNAQTDLKTGPNAQTNFEPFLPSEHANWNQTPGYTILYGPQVRRH